MTDPSALSQVAGFVAFILAAAAIAWGINRATNRSPIHEPEPSRLDTLDGVGQCHLRCGLAGTVVRREHPNLGTETVYVCPGHSDEGDRRGWWAA